ncbi:MAG: hypothetical protein JXB50_07540 [Spirochaetes bacterium]|nr:hypothetical protein [Spirochaetota bacterium]
MRNIVCLFLLIFINLSCSYLTVKKKIDKTYEENFDNKANKYLNQKKFRELNQYTTNVLILYPDYYKAAYYKAIALQQRNKNFGLNYYLNYINSYPEIPYDYKIRWIDLAMNVFKSEKRFVKKTKGLINESIDFDQKSESVFTKAKISQNKFYYFFLDFDGSLYMVNKKTKQFNKINYYKTRDFIVKNNFIFFNDSINLFKYDIDLNKYYSIHTFQEDYIYFENWHDSSAEYVLIKHKIEKNLLKKVLNLKNNEIRNLPDNCIEISFDNKYLIMEYIDKFDIFTTDGESLINLKGKFLGFGQTSDELFFFNQNYLYKYNISEKITNSISFISSINNFKEFQLINYNKILLSFDSYILIITLSPRNIILINGGLLFNFKNGFIFRINSDENLYYYNFFNGSKSILDINYYLDNDGKSNFIYSNLESNLFLLKENNKIIIKTIDIYF